MDHSHGKDMPFPSPLAYVICAELTDSTGLSSVSVGALKVTVNYQRSERKFVW